MLMVCQLHMLHETVHVSSCVGSRGLLVSRGQMDPDIHLERLAKLSLEDNKKVDAQEEKDDKDNKDDKQHHKKWDRIHREVSETKESQHDQNDQEDHKRMRSWADEGKTNPRHVEESAKWPRWRGWNPNKGAYHKEEEDYHKEEEEMEEKKQATTSTSSSSGTTGTATTDPDVYWDSEGSWHQWGGDWWQQDENGRWQKWQLPLQQ